jgi:hypothetical protein
MSLQATSRFRHPDDMANELRQIKKAVATAKQ